MAPTVNTVAALVALSLSCSASAEPGRLMRQDRAALSVDAAGGILGADLAAVQNLAEDEGKRGASGAAKAAAGKEGAILDNSFMSTRDDWNYEQTCTWATKYPDCGASLQSPINIEITAGTTQPGEDVLSHNLRYKSVQNCSINNNGHAVQVDGTFGSFFAPDGQYQVKQFHFHVPSEHSIGGELAAAEMQIVHQKVGATGTQGLAVVGILMEEMPACTDSAPCSYWRELAFLEGLGFGKELPTAKQSKPVKDAVDLTAFSELFLGEFYHYSGSLTTPPCTEGVHWYVMKKFAPITTAMLEDFKKNVLGFGKWNNRPVQASNGRPVVLDMLALPNEYKSTSGLLTENGAPKGSGAARAS